MKTVLWAALFICFDCFAINIIDHTSQFDRFWKINHEISDAGELLSRFKSEMLPHFGQFYSNRFATWKKYGREPEDVLLEKFKQYPSYRSRFLKTAKIIPQHLERAERTFRSAFPDLRKKIDVHIVHSLGEMDGGTRQYGNDFYFIFGADSIAKYHSSLEYEKKSPFLHHELFHVYHRQYFKESDSLLDGLWSEGLAVLAAEKLNPHANINTLSLNNPKGMFQKCQEQRDRLFRDILKRIDNPSERDYRTYFYGDSQDEWIPVRSGYCVGYLVAKEINRTNSLKRMVKFSKNEIKSSVIRVITDYIRKFN